VVGGAVADRITGNPLDNLLQGRGGDERMVGGWSNDACLADRGNDVLTGGAGDDVYPFDTDGALGSDTIKESGGGTDWLDFSLTKIGRATGRVRMAGAQGDRENQNQTLSTKRKMEG